MEDAQLLSNLRHVLFCFRQECVDLHAERHLGVVLAIIKLNLLRRFALVEELTPIVELVRTEETLLAVECFPLEDATVVADVVVVLVLEHVARAHSIDAFLPLFDGQRLMQVLIEDEDLVVLRHLLEAITVKLGRLGEVAGFDRLVLESVEHEELQKLPVAAISEHPLLRIRYVVHLETPYE